MTPAWIQHSHEQFTIAHNSSSRGIQCSLLASKGTITHMLRHTNFFLKDVLKGLGVGHPVHQNTCHYHRFMKGSRVGNMRNLGRALGRALCPGIVAHGRLINPPFSVCSSEAECRSIHAPNRLFVHTFFGLTILTLWGSSSSNGWSR